MVTTPGAAQTATAIALLALCTLAVGVMPNLAKLAFNDGTNPETLMLIRSAAGVAIFGAALALRGGSLKLPLAFVGLSVLAALANATFNFTYMSSIQYIDIGISTLILFTHPFFVAAWLHYNGSARLSVLQLVWSLLAFVGLALALATDFSQLDRTGLAYSVAAAIACTVMLLALVRVNKEVGGLTTCFFMSCAGLVLFSAWGASASSLTWPATTYGWTAALGVGAAFAVTYFTWLAAARIIGGSRATVLTFMEPVATIAFAALIFGERMTTVQWTGVMLVAAALFLFEAYPRRKAVTV